MPSVLNQFETGEIVNGYQKFVGGFAELADLAQEVSNDAESYRDFDVGVAVQAIRPGDTDPITITGSSYKIDHAVAANLPPEDEEELSAIDLHREFDIPERPPKNCGEMDSLLTAEEYARQKGLFIVGVVVAASTESDEIKEVVGQPLRTLPPCSECTAILTASEYTSRATLYASTGFSMNDPFEIRTIRNLQAIAEGRKAATDPRVSYLAPDIGARALELFNFRLRHAPLLGRRPSRAISTTARHALLEAGRRS